MILIHSPEGRQKRGDTESTSRGGAHTRRGNAAATAASTPVNRSLRVERHGTRRERSGQVGSSEWLLDVVVSMSRVTHPPPALRSRQVLFQLRAPRGRAEGLVRLCAVEPSRRSHRLARRSLLLSSPKGQERGTKPHFKSRCASEIVSLTHSHHSSQSLFHLVSHLSLLPRQTPRLVIWGLSQIRLRFQRKRIHPKYITFWVFM